METVRLGLLDRRNMAQKNGIEHPKKYKFNYQLYGTISFFVLLISCLGGIRGRVSVYPILYGQHLTLRLQINLISVAESPSLKNAANQIFINFRKK